MSSRRSAAMRNACCVASAAGSGPRPNRRRVRHTSSWCALNIRSSRSFLAFSSVAGVPPTKMSASDIAMMMPCRPRGRRSPKKHAQGESPLRAHAGHLMEKIGVTVGSVGRATELKRVSDEGRPERSEQLHLEKIHGTHLEQQRATGHEPGEGLT